jgi:hypothetical protein
MKRMRQTIRAGKRGTRKYLDEYGDKLLSVRYHYDWDRKRRITTVEIITQEKRWIPRKIPPQTIVKVEVEWGEADLARRIKSSGGKWNKEGKVWEIPFGKAKELGLQTRMVRK